MTRAGPVPGCDWRRSSVPIRLDYVSGSAGSGGGGRFPDVNVVVSSSRASYGRSVLVAVGWYATVAGAVLVGWADLPVPPNRDCSQMFSCMTPLQTVVLFAIVLGAPVFGVLLAMTLLIAAPLARRVASSVLAGTLPALASTVLAGVTGAAWQVIR